VHFIGLRSKIILQCTVQTENP